MYVFNGIEGDIIIVMVSKYWLPGIIFYLNSQCNCSVIPHLVFRIQIKLVNKSGRKAAAWTYFGMKRNAPLMEYEFC